MTIYYSNYNQSQLTHEELLALVEHQSKEIQELFAALKHLESKVVELENRYKTALPMPEFSPLTKTKSALVKTASLLAQPEQKEKALRDALRHLDNPAYLARCSLTCLIAQFHGIWPDSQTLQQLLYGAIEALRPNQDQQHELDRQLYYRLLVLTYVSKIRSTEIARLLAISLRQYQRELNAAIHMLIDYIWNQTPASEV